MDNQHRLIKGYRDLSESDVALMNNFKAEEQGTMETLSTMEKNDAYNKRSLALARTKFQEAYMWLIRAVARPNGE